MSRNAWLAILAFAVGAAPAIAELTLTSKPGPALALQVVSPKDAKPSVGPEPAGRDTNGISWKAASILSSSRGSISFRVKLAPRRDVLWLGAVPKTNASQNTVCSLSGTGGGEWFFSLW